MKWSLCRKTEGTKKNSKSLINPVNEPVTVQTYVQRHPRTGIRNSCTIHIVRYDIKSLNS